MSALKGSQNRIASFDSLRVFATFSVVLLHACVPYTHHRMPGLAWPTYDSSSYLIDVVFWGIEVWVMPLFLVLAGYLVVGGLRKKGAWVYLRHRSRRLLGTLCFAALLFLPLSLYCWLTGWAIDGLISARKIRSLAFESDVDANLWGLSHLWFLQYLFLYCCVATAMFAITPKGFSPAKRLLFRRHSAYLLLVTGIVALCWTPEVVFGFQHGFSPFPSKWIYNATFFFGGIWLALFDARLRTTVRMANRYMLVGTLATVAAIVTGTAWIDNPTDLIARILLSVSTVIAAWGITMGLIGSATQHLQSTRPAIRYLSAASLWIYLSHHWIVGLTHIDLKILLPAGHPILKAILAFTIPTVFCLLTFECFVRRSWIGRLLDVRLADTPNPIQSTAQTSDSNPAQIDDQLLIPRRKRA